MPLKWKHKNKLNFKLVGMNRYKLHLASFWKSYYKMILKFRGELRMPLTVADAALRKHHLYILSYNSLSTCNIIN